MVDWPESPGLTVNVLGAALSEKSGADCGDDGSFREGAGPGPAGSTAFKIAE